MTELSEITSRTEARGWLCYDGECAFCTALAHRFERDVRRHGFLVLPLQTPWVRQELRLNPAAPLREMVLLTRDRQRFGGIDALLYLAEQNIVTRPFAWLGRVGLIHRGLERAYAWVATRRACLGGACRLPGGTTSHHPTHRDDEASPL